MTDYVISHRNTLLMEWYRYYGAGIIPYFITDDGDCCVLLEKRSSDHTWAIPGGGYSSSSDGMIDSEPDLLSTALRELKEETGLFIKRETIWNVRTYKLSFFTYSVFAASMDSKAKPVLNHESEAAGWFSLNGLPDGMNFMTRKEISDFRRRIGYGKQE